MPVPQRMADLATLAASNSPSGSDPIGNSLDDYLRGIQAIVRSTNANSSATIASGSTTDIGASDAEAVTVTGTATISSFGTTPPGIVREVTFTGACVLVNSSALSLINNGNYTTVSGDTIRFRSNGLGNWRQVSSPAFTYRPVQQGTGIGQTNNDVKIGWSSGNKLKLTVDSADQGNFAFEAWVGNFFVPVTGNTALTGAPTLNGSAIATSATVAAGYLPLSGGSISGSLSVAGQITGASSAVLNLPASNGLGLKATSPISTITYHSVQNTSSGGREWLWGTTGSGNAIGAAGSCFIYDNTAFDARMLIDPAGNTKFSVSVSSPVVTQTSDGTLKTDFKAFAPRDLSDVPIVNYAWKASGKRGLSPIAQTVRKSSPEYVHADEDGILSVDKAGVALERVAYVEAMLKRLGMWT